MDLYPSDTIFIMKGFKKMAKLLLINISDPKSISRLVSPMNVHVETVSPAFFNETLERLASTNLSKKENIADLTLSGDSAFFKESLIIFCDVPDKKFDKILFKLRQAKISVDYKAVLTNTSSKWSVKRLFLELEREYKSLQ